MSDTLAAFRTYNREQAQRKSGNHTELASAKKAFIAALPHQYHPTTIMCNGAFHLRTDYNGKCLYVSLTSSQGGASMQGVMHRRPRAEDEDYATATELLSPHTIKNIPGFIEQSETDTHLSMLKEFGYLRFSGQTDSPEVAAKEVLALARKSRADVIHRLQAQMQQTEGQADDPAIYRL